MGVLQKVPQKEISAEGVKKEESGHEGAMEEAHRGRGLCSIASISLLPHQISSPRKARSGRNELRANESHRIGGLRGELLCEAGLWFRGRRGEQEAKVCRAEVDPGEKKRSEPARELV